MQKLADVGLSLTSQGSIMNIANVPTAANIDIMADILSVPIFSDNQNKVNRWYILAHKKEYFIFFLSSFYQQK